VTRSRPDRAVSEVTTENKPIRWGIAGTGSLARQLASDIGLAQGAVLSAVCSRDAARAKEFAHRPSGVLSFESLTSMSGSGAINTGIPVLKSDRIQSCQYFKI